jgi:Zn-dependent protease with chaperone function
MNEVLAQYYDGLSAKQQTVTLRISDGRLSMQGDEVQRDIPLNEVRISEKLGSTPRLLHFSNGGHCEVLNHAAFDTMLLQAGLQPQSLLSYSGNNWQHALAATLLTITVVIAGFYWGLPWLAKHAAEQIPSTAALHIDTQVLNAIDDGLMEASTLSAVRQQALRHYFDGLRSKEDRPPYRLEFRNSITLGANAFALPGGTIIVTDQLVALARKDEEIIAVLAHELGHVSERHPLRQLLQSSVVGLAMTWYLGDISSLLAAAPTMLVESSYSRNFERSADRYAINMLHLNGIAPSHLADMLEKLESSHTPKGEVQQKPSSLADLFSTHPDTSERIHYLRNNSPQ